jgi:hypothetical protein
MPIKQTVAHPAGPNTTSALTPIKTQTALLDFLETQLDKVESPIVISESTREIFDLIRDACGNDYQEIHLAHLDVVRALADGIVDHNKVITSHMMAAFIFKFLGVHSEHLVDSLTAIK